MNDEGKHAANRHIKWGPIAAIIITVGAYFASQILGGIVISIYPLLKHWNYAQTTKWLEQSILAQFAFIVVVESIILCILWLFLKRRHAKAEDIALKSPQLRDIGYALVGFGVYFVLYILVIQLVHVLVPGLNLEQKQDLGFSTSTNGNLLWLVFISLVILPPITEEILMRGFLYTGLKSKLTKINAAIITSLLFAAAHLQAGSGHKLLWVAAIDTFTLSFILVYLREKTDSLWASIGTHMIKNFVAFATLFIFKI